MSKVVTIPKDRNPFIVIVNGVEYKYPAGATIEVPDSVADVIEKYEGAKPKPDPTPTPGGGSGGSVQTDWNQKDSSAADFLKNKPFGDSECYILPEQELPYDPGNESCVGTLNGEINAGDTVTVVYDGVSYVCTAVLDPETGVVLFGNFSMIGAGDDTGEPFVALSTAALLLVMSLDTNSHVVGIISNVVKKLPAEYMEVRTFYVSFDDNDPYIYTDPMLKNKATKEEIIATAKIQNFRLVMVALSVPVAVMPVLGAPTLDRDVFMVAGYDLIGTQIKLYRTAEYAPEG